MDAADRRGNMGNKTTAEFSPNIALFRMMAGIIVTWLLIGVLLFGGAGRLDWKLGWIFFIVWGLFKILFIFMLRWLDPELLVERATRHENTQAYDRWLLPIYYLMSFGTILIAALDNGRFQWSGLVPAAVIVCVYIIYLLGNGLASWAVASNPFFSSESRLQADRDQRVTRKGPYQFIRHPAYSASIIFWPITGLMLGSWWSVIPGVLAALMMLIRTVYEDRMLVAELDGYAEYAQQVRYRLIPGIW
jgi:protein-S-isoprenylcysteine O-methyltransferase Ste14